jgi:hypothetical protein
MDLNLKFYADFKFTLECIKHINILKQIISK